MCAQRRSKRRRTEYDVVFEKLEWGIGHFFVRLVGDRTRGNSKRMTC